MPNYTVEFWPGREVNSVQAESEAEAVVVVLKHNYITTRGAEWLGNGEYTPQGTRFTVWVREEKP